MLEQQILEIEHQKWLKKLLGIQFSNILLAGLRNKAVDVLSRVPQAIECQTILVSNLISIADLQNHVATDPTSTKIIQ